VGKLMKFFLYSNIQLEHDAKIIAAGNANGGGDGYGSGWGDGASAGKGEGDGNGWGDDCSWAPKDPDMWDGGVKGETLAWVCSSRFWAGRLSLLRGFN
jgi:hypothetical protein